MVLFRYKKELGRRGQFIWRPVADVWFRASSGEWVELHPYIDSGADVTLIPYSFGVLLGIQKRNGQAERIGGISGSIEVINKTCSMKIGKKIMTVPLAWAQTEEVPALLGREKVFDAFHIIFRQDRKEIFFQES